MTALAVAALLFQFSAWPATSTDATEPDAKATVVQASIAKLPNLDYVKFPDQPAFVDKASASATLKTVAYDNGPQNSQSLSTLRIPENPAKQSEVKPATRYFSRRWLGLSLAQSAAAGFDAYSTRYAIGHGAVEEDPVMRPFVHSPAMYAASQVGPGILDYVALRMQRSANPHVRHVWWMPQIASTSLYLFSGFHNLHVGNNLSH